MKKITVFLLVALFIVAYMSNASYEQQSITSELKYFLPNEPSKEVLSHVELNFWGSPISIEEWGYHSFIELLIRKATHFFGYGILGVLFLFFYRRLHWKLPSILAILSVAMIASLDEYNQSSIPSRTGAVQDVLIDVAGAIVFISLAVSIHYFRKRHSSH